MFPVFLWGVYEMKVIASGQYKRYLWLTKSEVKHLARCCILILQKHPRSTSAYPLVDVLNSLCAREDFDLNALQVLFGAADSLNVDLPLMQSKDGKPKHFGTGKTFEKFVGLTYDERAQVRPYKHVQWIREVAAEMNFAFDPIEIRSDWPALEFNCITGLPTDPPPNIVALMKKNRDAETSKRKGSRVKRSAFAAESVHEEHAIVEASPSMIAVEQRNVELATDNKMLRVTHAQAMENLSVRWRKAWDEQKARADAAEKRVEELERRIAYLETPIPLRRVA